MRAPLPLQNSFSTIVFGFLGAPLKDSEEPHGAELTGQCCLADQIHGQDAHERSQNAFRIQLQAVQSSNKLASFMINKGTVSSFPTKHHTATKELSYSQRPQGSS